MKILVTGNPSPAAEEPWWVGQELECGKCGCRIELEAKDAKDRVTEEHGGCDRGESVSAICPYCPTVLRAFRISKPVGER